MFLDLPDPDPNVDFYFYENSLRHFLSLKNDVNAPSKSNEQRCGAGAEELKLNCLLEPEPKLQIAAPAPFLSKI